MDCSAPSLPVVHSTCLIIRPQHIFLPYLSHALSYRQTTEIQLNKMGVMGIVPLLLYWHTLLVSCSCSDPLQPPGLQHTRLPCPALSPRVYSNSCLLSQWCHPTTSASVAPFSSCPQSFPASRSFLMSRFFTSGGQSIGASTSVLPMNTQDWSPLRWTGWISLQSKGLSRAFSNITVRKHQFFSDQPSLFMVQRSHLRMTRKVEAGRTKGKQWVLNPL